MLPGSGWCGFCLVVLMVLGFSWSPNPLIALKLCDLIFPVFPVMIGWENSLKSSVVSPLFVLSLGVWWFCFPGWGLVGWSVLGFFYFLVER